jgi:hypothetical protein
MVTASHHGVRARMSAPETVSWCPVHGLTFKLKGDRW